MYVEEILKNVTRFYEKGDRVTGILHPRGHVKKRLSKLSVHYLKSTICTDTVFCSRVKSIKCCSSFELF